MSKKEEQLDRAMEELVFQRYLISIKKMHRRKIPQSLKDQLYNFFMYERATRLRRAAEVMFDLNQWILTPNTLSRIVIGTSVFSPEDRVKMWMVRLGHKMPDFRDCLSFFPGVGYSLGVNKLFLKPEGIISHYQSYKWLKLINKKSDHWDRTLDIEES